jgi:subtilase family serine protease
LEVRDLPSAAGWQSLVAQPYFTAQPLGTGGPGKPAFYPVDLRTAYGVTGISGDGTGQTIAIIDAFNDPKIKTDLASFDTKFGLVAPPSFRVVNQSGGSRLPTNSPKGSWDVEESLDVEWAHSIAPEASIILVEASSPTYANLITHAANWARKQPGVSVVSMSFGGGEFSTETSFDTDFTTPTGHAGVTFVASTGDGGAPGGYPAFSPNVLAVGGTKLTENSSSNWVSETGWSGSGGGKSVYENEPSYQNGVQSTGKREMPDVAFDASPSSGVYVIDTYAGGAFQVGGTSLAAPCWAGLIAIANQVRVSGGLGTLSGTQAQGILYGLPASDWHDITSGNNGFAAGPGYDLVTGIGTPIANLLVPDLGSHAASHQVALATPPGGSSGSGGGTVAAPSAQVVVQELSVGTALPAGATQQRGVDPAGLLSHGVSAEARLVDALFAGLTLSNTLFADGL